MSRFFTPFGRKAGLQRRIKPNTTIAAAARTNAAIRRNWHWFRLGAMGGVITGYTYGQIDLGPNNRTGPILAIAALIYRSYWALVGQRFNDLYLGRVFGPTANGLFSVAGELARMPVSEIAAPINRVAC
jgi:hypothetical protein